MPVTCMLVTGTFRAAEGNVWTLPFPALPLPFDKRLMPLLAVPQFVRHSAVIQRAGGDAIQLADDASSAVTDIAATARQNKMRSGCTRPLLENTQLCGQPGRICALSSLSSFEKHACCPPPSALRPVVLLVVVSSVGL